MSRMAAKRPKNFTRFSRTMTGGEKLSVPVMRRRSVLSTSSELLSRRARLRSCQGGLLRIPVGRRSRARLPRLFGSVLGSALGLNVGGAEDAVPSKFPFREGLGVVLEGVGRGLGSAINHWECAVLLDQQELHVSALALDGSRDNIAGHAQPLTVRAVAHAIQFLDGDIVALAVLHSRVGKVPQRKHNHRDYRAKAHVPASLIRHRMEPLQIEF